MTAQAAAIPAAPNLARAVPARSRRARTPWAAIGLFLLPAACLYCGLTAWPVLRTLWNSLHHVLPARESWVGLSNYAALWADPLFWRAVRNTLAWSLAAPVLEVGIGLLLALALFARVPGARLLRVAWFAPVLMSYVVVGVVWSWLLNWDWGAVNVILRLAGLAGWARPWLGDPATALPALAGVTTWMWAGFNMVVLLAALHSLPAEVLEAAELDGAGWWTRLRRIVVPLVRPTLLNLLVLSFVGKMKIFDLVWITTKGGPLWSTETVSTYTYKRAFEWSTFDLGYPSAVATVWFGIVMLAVGGLTWLSRRQAALEY